MTQNQEDFLTGEMELRPGTGKRLRAILIPLPDSLHARKGVAAIQIDVSKKTASLSETQRSAEGLCKVLTMKRTGSS